LVRDGLFQSGAADSNKKNTPRPLDGLQIIDVGCGGGLLSEVEYFMYLRVRILVFFSLFYTTYLFLM